MNLEVPSDIVGIKHLVTLPDEYDHQDLKMTVYDDFYLIIMCPNCEPLRVDRRTGEYKVIKPSVFPHGEL